jgi:predicted nucleic acid-binding protein
MNVLSEAMRASPDPLVAAWMAGQDPNDLFTTSVSEAEILLGIAILPDGRRKSDLQAAAERVFTLFVSRRLPFDSGAASHFRTSSRCARLPAGRSTPSMLRLPRLRGHVEWRRQHATSLTLRESKSI